MTSVLVGTSTGLVTLGGARPIRDLDGHEVSGLAVDGPLAWAVGDGDRLWRHDGGGWHVAARVAGPPATCVAAAHDDVLVGTVGAHLLHLEGSTLAPVAPYDEMPGRDSWTQPWGAPPDARSVAVADDRTWYVNAHVGGIARSRDHGSSWSATVPVDVDVHQVLPVAGDQLVAATGAAGLATSTDGGATWSYATEGLHGTYLRAVAVAADRLVASASTGPRTSRGALYVRALEGGPFERCRAGLPEWFGGNVDTHRLAAAGDLVVCAGPDGTVYRSDDRGDTWAMLATDLGDVLALAVVP